MWPMGLFFQHHYPIEYIHFLLNLKAVQNVEAQISKECLAFLLSFEDLEKRLKDCSGVMINKSNESKWILFGNLPQIELAHTCLQDMISEIKTSRQIPSEKVPDKSKAPTVNSDLLHEKCKLSLKMSDKGYWRFSEMFPFSRDQSGANSMHYSSEDQTLHVSGTNSFVKLVENQVKSLFVEEIKISKDAYSLLKTDICRMQQDNQGIRIYFIEKEGNLEVFGMSDASVKSVVKTIEERRRSLMKECPKRDRKLNVNPNTKGVQPDMKKTPQKFMPYKILKNPVHFDFILKPNFQISLYMQDILNCDVDAICCGQDSSFQSKSHIAKSINQHYKNVGKHLTKKLEKRKYYNGEVVMIKCDGKPPKHIIFVVTESPASAKELSLQTRESIKMCFSSILEHSNLNNIKSLAMPLLGTGKYDYILRDFVDKVNARKMSFA